MGKRKKYNTTLNVNLLKKVKILAARLDLRQNVLIEEAIQDLIKKYKHKKVSRNASRGLVYRFDIFNVSEF